MSPGLPTQLFDGAPIVFADPVWLWALLLPPLLVLVLPKAASMRDRVRNMASLGLKVLALWALVLAAAQPEQILRRPDLSLVVVQDGSSSMSPARQRDAGALAQRYLRQAQDLDVVRVQGPTLEPAQGTDLAALIAQGVASAAPARSRRMLLLSDGADTVEMAQGERAVAAAALAGAAGVRIYPLPPVVEQGNAGLLQLDWPVQVRARETVSGVVKVHATGAMERRLVLRARRIGELQGGAQAGAQAGSQAEAQPLLSLDLSLQPGTQEVLLEFKAPSKGTWALTATLEGSDPWPQDDARQGWLVSTGQGPLLVQGVHSERVAELLVGQGLAARSIERIPKRPPQNATLFVLGPDLSRWHGEGDLLAQFVRDGGDLILGGGAAGLGSDSPELESLERALPLVFPNKRKRQPPPLAVIYVVDRSDSMGRHHKLNLAVAAVQASVELMSPEARVGVIAFSDSPEWIVPLTRARNKAAIVDSISALGVHGGTEIYPALEEAWLALQATDASLKHIILLTDGRGTSRYEQNSDLIARIARSQVTVSTVALSGEAARDELRQVAEAGGGRAYYTETYSDVPRIFIDETLNLMRRNVKEQDTAVRAVPGSRLAGTVDWSTVPQLTGHNPSKPKAAADLGLVLGDRSRPLLASWRFGRGSATVFASELAGGWSAQWNDWPSLGPWLGQLVRAIRDRPEPLVGSSLEVWELESGAQVQLSVQDAMGKPRVGLSLSLRVSEATGGVQETVALSESVPGVYRGLMPWQGALLLEAQVPGTRGTPAQVLFEQAAPPVPAELAGRLMDLGLLERIAAASGGRVLPSMQELLVEDVREKEERRGHFGWLVVFGVVVLVGDVGVRRVRL